MKSAIRFLFLGASSRVKLYLIIMRFFKKNNLLPVAIFLSNRMQISHGIFLSAKAQIPASTKFPHPTGIVIGDGVIIGEDVTIYQNVTLGGKKIGDWAANNYPKIGNNCVIFSGASILGNITIGQDVTIGANSVVLTSIPDYSVAVGAPARVIKRNSSHEG